MNRKTVITPDYNYAAHVFYTFSAKQLLCGDFKIGTWVTPLKDICVYIFTGSLGKI